MLILTLLRENRNINIFAGVTISILTFVFAVTLGAGRGYHKIYQDVGSRDILAVFEGNIACPYISLVPEPYVDAVLKVPHVVDVACEVRQRYTYGKDKNLTLTAMEPDKLLAFKDIQIDDETIKAFQEVSNGALVGRKIFDFFDWKVGREVRTAGLVFTVTGVFEQPLSVYESMVILHKDYLQQITAKQGYATALLVKTDLPGSADQEGVIRNIEAAFEDHSSKIVCRPEDQLWLAIKSSQGNLGDIILVLGIALGALLVILHINNGLFTLKRKGDILDRLKSRGMPGRSITALVFWETVTVSVLSGVLAGFAAYLAAFNHPYVGSDMFHPPIYIDGRVLGVVAAVSLLSGLLAGLVIIPAVRGVVAGSALPATSALVHGTRVVITVFKQKKLLLAGTVCMACMVVVFSTAMTLGTTLKALIMNQGTKGNLIVVDAGADTPMFSSLPAETYDFARSVPKVAVAEGHPMVTRSLQLASLVYGYFTTVRGVDPLYYRMYDQWRLIEGRLPTDVNEVMVGTLLSAKVDRTFKVGDEILFEGRKWNIVGLFEDPLTVMGSGIVARLEDIQKATHRDYISFVSLRAESREDMEAIAAYINKTYDALLMENPEVPGVIAEPEEAYYHHESEAINPLVLFINLVSALYLAVGAMVIYNIADSMVGNTGGKAPWRVSCDGRDRKRLVSAVLRLAVMAVLGGGIAALLKPLIGNISVNFMMMTFYLEISNKAMVMGTLVAAALGLAAVVVWVKMTRTSAAGIKKVPNFHKIGKDDA